MKYIESGPASHKHTGVYVAGGNKKWRNLRKYLLRKSCAVYTLIIAFIWLLYTLPIIQSFSFLQLMQRSVLCTSLPNINVQLLLYYTV
jgi:hypothetical protein